MMMDRLISQLFVDMKCVATTLCINIVSQPGQTIYCMVVVSAVAGQLYRFVSNCQAIIVK